MLHSGLHVFEMQNDPPGDEDSEDRIKEGRSPTLREGVILAEEHPPSRSGFCLLCPKVVCACVMRRLARSVGDSPTKAKARRLVA